MASKLLPVIFMYMLLSLFLLTVSLGQRVFHVPDQPPSHSCSSVARFATVLFLLLVHVLLVITVFVYYALLLIQ